MKGSGYPTDTSGSWECGFCHSREKCGSLRQSRQGEGVLKQGMGWDCQALTEVLQPHSPRGLGVTRSVEPSALSLHS